VVDKHITTCNLISLHTCGEELR